MKRSGMFVALQRLVRRCVGLREVTLPGLHCGTCGKWINEPTTLWRRGGKVTWADGWGLCNDCVTCSYSTNKEMKMLKEWQEMPEIVLPWKGVETGFTITSWKGVCPTCKVELVKPRGKIYESFGVVELDIGGVCPKCRHLVPTRSRVYPKTCEFAQKTSNGWEKTKMSKQLTFNQIWLRATMNLFAPPVVGIIVAAFLLEPPRAVCIVCVVAVINLGMSVALGYYKAKENK